MSEPKEARPGSRLFCAWIVDAGDTPGVPIRELGQVWGYTHDDRKHDQAGSTKETFRFLQKEACEYATYLQNHAKANWVTLRWELF